MVTNPTCERLAALESALLKPEALARLRATPEAFLKALSARLRVDRLSVEAALSAQAHTIEVLSLECTRYEDRLKRLETELGQITEGGYLWK